MATRNIVPRADNEGGLGTTSKKWANLWATLINALTLTAQSVGFTVAGGTTSKTLTITGDATISGGTHSGTNTGDVAFATTSDLNTGTETTKTINPDVFAGSNFGIRYYGIKIFDDATVVTTGDGKFIFAVPVWAHGMNLVSIFGAVTTVSSSGALTINSRRIRTGSGAATNDVLSTALTIDQSEKNSSTAATAAVINTSYDDMSQNATTQDELTVDVDAAGTGAKGLMVYFGFQLP